MTIYELCERCDRREHHWNVREYRIEVAELNRKPHLCDECAATLMSAILVALRKPKSSDVE